MNRAQRLLLVDDEIRFGETLKQILSFYGYQVTVATCGQDAATLLRSQVFDVALLDVELPDMYGYDLLDTMRENNPAPVTIMLTGNSSVDSAIQALRKGAYDYLKKPVDSDLLLKTIEKAIKHQKLELALKSSEERFKILANASWEGIVIHDRGVLLEANHQFFTIFGYTKKELIGTDILGKLFLPQSLVTIRSRIQNGEIGFHEATGVRRDGSTFPIETNSSYIEFQGKNVRVCAIRDISVRIRAEQEKIRLLERLAIANKIETLGLMAGSIAHDLNNILSGIVTFPEIILMQMDKTDKHRDSIEFIRDTGKRAAAVVSDMLTMARGTTAPKGSCDLNALITTYLASPELQEHADQLQDIHIVTDLADNLPAINCSEPHITKVIMNLLHNSMEAIKKKGVIAISTKSVVLDTPLQAYELINAGEYVVFSITDNGPGIPEQALNKIFEPFYSKKEMGRSGTGLGLAIVLSTVHDHNGFVHVQSNEHGTTFELFFPVCCDPADDTAAVSMNAYKGHGETILVVDDQADQRAIACNLLNKLSYRPCAVASGEEAIAYLQQNSADLIILDMIMEPGINGRETFEQILTIHPAQKAILASGFSSDEEIGSIRQLGVSQFITKPYTIAQIGMAIKQALLNP